MMKRKADRSFLDRWEAEYLFTYVHTYTLFTYLCGANVAISKERNIRRHHETKHQDKHKDLEVTQGCQKAEEMKRGLVT